MKPIDIKATLAALGAKPNKKLGQHFLIDRAALDTIVAAADITKGDTVLEIGPGLGVLTEALLDAGASVTAIEQDRLFISYLEDRFQHHDFNITHGDATAVHWHDLVGKKPWKLVSNLPYSMTSLALRKALWSPRPAERIAVLIQREVAERAIAKNGKTSLLSLSVALASSATRIVRRVPAGAFFPPPKVQSAVLEIFPLPLKDRVNAWGIDPERIMEVARRGFAHPRKQLAANLASTDRPKDAVQVSLRDLNINDRVRAEDLTPKQWAALTRALHSAKKPRKNAKIEKSA